MKSSTFSNQSNARRAARKAIANGTAPSGIFAIERIGAKGARDARFTIIWHKSAEPDGTSTKPKWGRRGHRAAGPAVGGSRPRSKNVDLDAAAAAGIMPERPIVTSHANIRGQKRFDYLAERAAAGDWAAVKAYAINSNNTQAKQLKRYQARLLAYFEAVRSGTAAA